jgi:TorA maturation chaperone TorD
MTATSGISPATVPTWGMAQLLADWWSDPLDGVPPGSADPTGGMALAAGARLGVDEHRLIALAVAADAPGLVDEHERMFVGPGRTPCPPYESMWSDDAPPDRGIMMATAAGAVLSLYRQAGLAMRPHPGELPDHLVVECEALAWCLERNREPTVARALLADHLVQWVPRFCDAVRVAANHPYYRELAEITPVWIAALLTQVESPTASP